MLSTFRGMYGGLGHTAVVMINVSDNPPLASFVNRP